MRSICITGNSVSSLDHISKFMYAAGVQSPEPARFRANIDILSWQDRVAASSDTLSPSFTIKTPGTLWEQLATDIILANSEKSVWGWASLNSVRFLDFWQKFDTNICFLLVYSDPITLIADSIEHFDEEENIKSILSLWQLLTQEILIFYNRNPERCILLNANECVINEESLIEKVNQTWKCTLKSPTQDAIIKFNVSSGLSRCLAEYFLYTYPQIKQLHNEIKATYNKIKEGKSCIDRPEFIAVLDEYRQLKSNSLNLKAPRCFKWVMV